MRLWVLLLLLILLHPLSSNLQAQPADYSRIELGANINAFRISLDKFDDFYEKRWTYPIGAAVEYAFSPSFHLYVYGKTYTQNATFVNPLDQEVDLEIKQSWVGVGIKRLNTSLTGKSRTSFGFGLVFFVIEENKQGYLLSELLEDSRTIKPKGFFLSGSYDRFISRMVNLSLQLELSSAAVGDGFGLESQSFGGILIGVGLNFGLF